jgi:alpha-D-ribose 1-methylphosphonate 5-triphosphate diphosphatase
MTLADAVATVSDVPAAAVGLADRGRIAVGLRADLIRVQDIEGLPIVRTVWREGRRVA